MMVVFSGGGTAGHFHPARNIAEALTGVMPEVQPYFVGTEGRVEAAELPALDYPYRLLPVAGLQNPLGVMRRAGRGAQRLSGLFRAVAGNIRAFWLLARAVARLVPDFRRRGAAAVVLTGGYVCAPAGIAGRLLGLPPRAAGAEPAPRQDHPAPVTLGEADPPGVSGSGTVLPEHARERVLHSGNPIRPLPPPARRGRDAARRALGLPAEGRLVLVVGGSQGAHKMNQATIEILQDDMPIDDEFVLWVTGRTHYEAAEAALAGVPRQRFEIVPYLEGDRMYQALAGADLVVSRAGAMATSEFLAWGLPAILVPLPAAAGDHQSSNARALEAAGTAIHLPERDISGADLRGERLWSEVRRVFDTPGLLAIMSEAARRRARPDAAGEVAAAIATLLRPGPAGAVS